MNPFTKITNNLKNGNELHLPYTSTHFAKRISVQDARRYVWQNVSEYTRRIERGIKFVHGFVHGTVRYVLPNVSTGHLNHKSFPPLLHHNKTQKSPHKILAWQACYLIRCFFLVCRRFGVVPTPEGLWWVN